MVASTLLDQTDVDGSFTVGWSDASKPGNFYSWRVYHKPDDDTVWTQVFETFQDVANFSQKLYSWSYGPQQVVVVASIQDPNNGAITETAYTGANALNPSVAEAGYWIVDNADPTRNLKLHVTKASEKLTDDTEIVPLLGGGHKVSRGGHTGWQDRYTIQLITSNIHGTPAAQKRILERLQREAGEIIVRSPFGALKAGFVSDVSLEPYAGTGRYEAYNGSITVTGTR